MKIKLQSRLFLICMPICPRFYTLYTYLNAPQMSEVSKPKPVKTKHTNPTNKRCVTKRERGVDIIWKYLCIVKSNIILILQYAI